MIEQLHIKDVTLIHNAEINLSPMLNILSGETGAGKSIVIDSINFVMGGKAHSGFVRRGCDYASVSALLYINSSYTISFLKDKGIDIEDDNKILIVRTCNASGKTNLTINTKPMPLAILKVICAQTIDIHGQFEHQFLLDEKQHINLLDKFCTSEMDNIKKELNKTIDLYKQNNDSISMLETKNKDAEELRYEIEELLELSLKSGEEEKVLEELKYLSNFRDVKENTNEARFLLNLENGARDKITKAIRHLKNIEGISKVNPIIETLESVNINLEEICRDLSIDSEAFDINRLQQLEERLGVLHQVKRKYKMEIEDIITYTQDLKLQLDEIENSETILIELKQQRKNLQKFIVNYCEKLTQMRTIAKKLLEEQVIENLKDLGMKNVQFEINIEKKQTFSTNGNDIVNFLISANLGEPLRPIAKVASGGEMSRIMLSLKIVLSQTNTIETFVFDEIDTGVSGRAAQMVANKLHILSQKKQILCISHLPQIASMADTHFLIEKLSYNNTTATNINMIKDTQIIEELARLIGGTKITENTLTAAKEMKDMANNFKN